MGRPPASKRKGLWMGGPVPLGYQSEGRTLVIAEAEAETVRTLFRLYLERGTVRQVKEEADRRGLTTKVHRAAGRRMRGGQPLSRGHLYHLLSSPVYIGRIPHNGDSYEGRHPAIIDPETWDAVQKRLAAQAPARHFRAGTGSRSLLQGKLFDEAGARLTPSHTVKSGRRYRYYVSRDSGRRPRWRLPADEIERFVAEAVVALFASRAELARLARQAQIEEARVPDLLERVGSSSGKPLDFVHRVDLGAEEIAVHIDLSKFLGSAGAVVRHVIPTRIRRRGVERRIVLHGGPGAASEARVDPALVKAVVRGRRWFEDLASGRAESIAEIAQAEGVSARYVGHLIPLAFLAPDIVARILSGTQPVDLTTENLTKRIDLPLAWTQQRTLLGFD